MTKKFKILLLTFLILIVFGFWGIIKIQKNIAPHKEGSFPFIQIANSIIKVEIADELAEQIQGLSNRPTLPANTGLLFLFSYKQIHFFWMKNMHFPIDIIWIDDDTVVNIHKNLPPEEEMPEFKYSSEHQVNRVLEVNAGWTDAQGIEVGDKVKYSL